METRSVTLTAHVIPMNELSESDSLLLEAARKAMSHAYAPYSHFLVGAALLLENGETIKGSNQENASFPNGLCGESVAMFAAASAHPGVAFNTLAIATQAESPVAPCGMCRQTMTEYSQHFGKTFRLVLAGKSDEVMVIEDAAQLLPLSFSAEFLKR